MAVAAASEAVFRRFDSYLPRQLSQECKRQERKQGK